jgi:hypothetical protein
VSYRSTTASSDAATGMAARQAVWEDGGTFLMGSEEFYPEERPVHRVAVDGFWMDTMLLTPSIASQLLARGAYLSGAPIEGLERGDPLAGVLEPLGAENETGRPARAGTETTGGRISTRWSMMGARPVPGPAGRGCPRAVRERSSHQCVAPRVVRLWSRFRPVRSIALPDGALEARR